MTFINDWRQHIPESLSAFASLVVNPADVQLAFLAAAVLWPIREMAIDNEEAGSTLQQIFGNDAIHMLALVRAWPDDRRAVAQDLARRAADDAALQVRLIQLVRDMLAPAPSADPLGGAVEAAVTNFIVHIGDTISVNDATNTNINVKSSLTNVGQRISATTAIDEDTKALLRQLIAQLATQPAAIKASRKTLFWMVMVGVALISLTGGLARLYLGMPLKSVLPMSGVFNIAVAEFGQIDSEGRIVQSSTGNNIAQKVYEAVGLSSQALNKSFGLTSVTGIQVISPTAVGLLKGSTLKDQDGSAETFAIANKADMVVYGSIRIEDDAIVFMPRFYLAERVLRQNAEDLVGVQPFGPDIRVKGGVNDISTLSELTTQVISRSQSLSQFAIGIDYYRKEDYINAIGHFLEASKGFKDKDDKAVEGSEFIYLFLGTSFNRRNDIESREKGLQMAEFYYDEALKINPNYARALLGKAEIRYQRYHGIGCNVNVSRDELIKTIGEYKKALNKEAPDQADIQAKTNYFVGRVYVCLGRANPGNSQDDFIQAENYFNSVLNDYKTNSRLRYIASQSHYLLGMINELRAARTGTLEDQNGIIELHFKAIEQYKAAIGTSIQSEWKAYYTLALAEIYLRLANRCPEAANSWRDADNIYKSYTQSGLIFPGYENYRKDLLEKVWPGSGCPVPSSTPTK